MRPFNRRDDHPWVQTHLSHYVEGDLSRRSRRRFDRHAEECVDCGRGLRAMRGLVRLLATSASAPVQAPPGIFDRVHASQDARPDR